MVNLYFKAVDRIEDIKGNVFNIGGGVKNSMSLLELFLWLEKEKNININVIKKEWRLNDQKVFIANINKAKELIKWKPKVDKEKGLKETIKWYETLLGESNEE